MVRTEIKAISNCKKELNILMEKADLQPIREREAKRVQREVQFPGFRKGKAPLSLIIRNFSDTIEAYTLEAALDEGLQKSVTDHNVFVVGRPEVKKVDFNESGDLISVVEVETLPEIELKNYKNFVVTKDEYEISDKFVDETIQRYLKEKAELHTVDGKIEKDHLVVMDMQELDQDGKPIKNKNYKDISIRVGEGRFDPELEEQILDLKVGDQKRIDKIYPDDFPQKDFAGKKESYTVKIKSVQREELPELNDEFVKEFSAEMQSVDDFKRRTRQQLENEYRIEAENRFFQDLSQKLLNQNPFEIPAVLVDNYLEHIYRDVKKRDPKVREEIIRQHYQAEAESAVKLHYLREQIAKTEKIEVTEEDQKVFLDELKNEKVREFYEKNQPFLERAKEDILNKKIDDFLAKNTKIQLNKLKL